MVALLAIGFCWAHKTGEWRAVAVKPIKLKNHGRPAKSLFRYGLDYLSGQLLKPLMTAKESALLLVLFMCPPHWIIVRKNGIKIVVKPLRIVGVS